MLLNPDSSVPPWYWWLTPHVGRFLYVCPDKELHWVTLFTWGTKVLWSRDRMVVPLRQLFQGIGAMAAPSAEDEVGLAN